MYRVNFTNAMKEIKILSLRNIMNELDLLKKTIIIQWNVRKKDWQLFATKLIEKTIILVIAKNNINLVYRKKIQTR